MKNYEMKNRVEKKVEVFLKTNGDEFKIINKIRIAIDDNLFDKFYANVEFEGTDLIGYMEQAYKEEVQAKEENRPIDELSFFERDYDSLKERNRTIYNTINDSIDKISREIESEISCYYSNLENLFMNSFGRVPKLLDTVKRAAALSDTFEAQVIETFNMRKINVLKKKDISNINIFLFIFKYPFVTLDSINKMSSEEILELSKQEIKASTKSLFQYCYNKEGIKGINKILKVEAPMFIPSAFCEYEDRFYELDLTVDNTLAILSIGAWEVDKFLNNAKMVSMLKSNLLKFEDVLELIKNNKELDKIKNLMVEHDLKDCPVQIGNEICSIMAWDDLRQFFLGRYTACCQRFGEPGESSMLFGIVSKHSGFLTIQRDGKILGQAWVWEANKNTLVLDNIELANCRDVKQFKPLLREWCKNSPYTNIQLGLGCSDMKLGKHMYNNEIKCYSLFRSRAFTAHTKTFFKEQKIYTDAQERRNWLKKNNAVIF